MQQVGGSATEQNGVQDFKISRFHWDLRISMGFQFMNFEISMGFMGFLWISGFLWDFNLWISRFLWDLWDFYGIISVFYGNNRYFTEIIGINNYIAWDFGSRIQARFQLGFQHLRPRFQLVADPSQQVLTYVAFG